MTTVAGKGTRVLKPLFDADAVRKDFPILSRTIGGSPLVYLDNAATTQKPEVVIGALADYYREINANVHRGVHRLSMEATERYEAVRETVRSWMNAASTKEIVFVRGTTEAINLVASSYGGARLVKGDEVLITGLEHHSNIVPWQLLAARTGSVLKVVRIEDDGSVSLEAFRNAITSRTRLVAVSHVSNALGTVNPVREMAAIAHEHGAVILVDGAQALPHGPVDVRSIGADFYAFSGHKIFGPTGIGILYGRESLLEEMPPYQGGGDMIRSVTFEGTTYNDLPYKFEAGTPNIAGTIGLGASIRYMSRIDWTAAKEHEHRLLAEATGLLSGIEGIRIVGTAAHKEGVLSFTMDDVHPHDIGTILDREGIAIRTGHHCAQPVMDRFGIPATARASFAIYNTVDDVHRLAAGLRNVRSVMGL